MIAEVETIFTCVELEKLSKAKSRSKREKVAKVKQSILKLRLSFLLF